MLLFFLEKARWFGLVWFGLKLASLVLVFGSQISTNEN